MYMQPNHTYCDIFDSNCKKYAEQFDEVGCCRLFAFPNGAESNMPFDYVWGQMTEGENSHLALGYLQKAAAPPRRSAPSAECAERCRAKPTTDDRRGL